MPDSNTHLVGIEQGRASKAYEFAQEGKSITTKFKIDNQYYKDDKYGSYVKKIPMLIKNNGLGSTFAFVKSSCTKTKNKKEPGTDENPKNAYDLIYKQTSDWLKNKKLIGDTDLASEIIKKNSTEYRVLTNEVLALFNWLRRFAEGGEE